MNDDDDENEKLPNTNNILGNLVGICVMVNPETD